MTTADPYAELEAALTPLRAAQPGITYQEVAPLLPERLRRLLWELAVDRYLDDKLAELDAWPGPKPVVTATTILDGEDTR